MSRARGPGRLLDIVTQWSAIHFHERRNEFDRA